MTRLGSRLVILALAASSVAAGVVAGCGFDGLGSLEVSSDASSENAVGAKLPEGGALEASVDGAVVIDAGLEGGTGACSDSLCVMRGGTCNAADNSCVFQCTNAGSCPTGIACPPGVRCKVTCDGIDSCRGTVDCTEATACDVGCAGKHACEAVKCAGKKCAVQCSGMDSCFDGGIACTATDSCTVACNGTGAMNCNDPVACTSSFCDVECADNACAGGVIANAADAAINCGKNACLAGETCYSQYCELSCKGGGCANKLCCDAGATGTCILEGGLNNCN